MILGFRSPSGSHPPATRLLPPSFLAALAMTVSVHTARHLHSPRGLGMALVAMLCWLLAMPAVCKSLPTSEFEWTQVRVCDGVSIMEHRERILRHNLS